MSFVITQSIGQPKFGLKGAMDKTGSTGNIFFTSQWSNISEPYLIVQRERPPWGQLWMEQCLTPLKHWPI